MVGDPCKDRVINIRMVGDPCKCVDLNFKFNDIRTDADLFGHALSNGDVPLVGFMYIVFTRMPGDRCVGDLGLCFCTCVTYFEG